jgi:hypothetical protein
LMICIHVHAASMQTSGAQRQADKWQSLASRRRSASRRPPSASRSQLPCRS